MIEPRKFVKRYVNYPDQLSVGLRAGPAGSGAGTHKRLRLVDPGPTSIKLSSWNIIDLTTGGRWSSSTSAG